MPPVATALEIAFAAGLVVVALSFAGVGFFRLSERAARALALLLGLGALAACGGLALNLVDRFTDTGPLVLAAGGLAAAALGELGLVALVRASRRLRDVERLNDEAANRLSAVLDRETAARAAELERTLARERAHASHALLEQERKLAEERREALARQVERARVELTESVAAVQQRLERRLAAWAADLDRGQRVLELRLTEISERQREAVAEQEARITRDGEQIAALADDQQAHFARVRTELERQTSEALQEARTELEAQSDSLLRGLREISDRVRDRERELRVDVERDEVEARARLAAELEQMERRQVEQLERALERAAGRLGEEADRRFEAQIRESRERSAEQLGRELDKMIDQFTRQAERDVAERIAQIAEATSERVERRLDELGRSGAAQHEVAAERIGMLAQRLDETVAKAEQRITAFEAQFRSEMAAKMSELERAIRAGNA